MAQDSERAAKCHAFLGELTKSDESGPAMS